MRRSWGMVFACAVLAAGVPAAQSAPQAQPSASEPSPGIFPQPPPGFPEIPPEIESMAAQRRASARGSNVMWATTFSRKHRGYGWGLTALKAAPAAKTSLEIAFARTAAQGTQLQASVFSWTLRPGALRMDSNLKPASLRTGDGMGSNGSISMKLTEPGRFFRFEPEGCSGAVTYRVARFGGRFRFNARDEYFEKLGLSSTRVFLWRDRDLRCDYEAPPPVDPNCPELLFGTAADGNGVAVGASRTKQGAVDQLVVATGKSGDADTQHMISVGLAVPDAFSASDDGTSATVDGDAGGPWLSGDLSYVAPPGADSSDDDCGAYRQSSGVATGDYTAHFDSIGPVTPATTGLAATLRRDL